MPASSAFSTLLHSILILFQAPRAEETARNLNPRGLAPILLPLLAAVSVTLPCAIAKPPYIGVAYYPEVAGPQIEKDVAQMKKIGVNLVRFGEFSWSRMEPSEEQYDFTWLHHAVNLFTKAGIDVQICTPTASPPAWLIDGHPDILRTSVQGFTMGHGGRRPYCPNSETYRHYSEKIAAKLAEEFKDSPGVIGWQIDNEFWGDCYCKNCEHAFHAWLKQHFGSIDKLNSEWLTVLWSQEYQSFEQVPLPNPSRVGAGHHPSLKTAYQHFMSDSYISFCEGQAAELRKYVKGFVTTNAHNPIYQRIDYTELFRHLDLVCTDSYAKPDNLPRYAFEADWMRPLGKPFWLAETQSTHNGGTAVNGQVDFANFPGSMRAKMWISYALGCDAVSFWHWRAHWAGQELEHGALIYQWGDECANTPEIHQVADELTEHAAWLRSTRPKPAKVALQYGIPSEWQFNATPIADDFQYDKAISGFHRMLVDGGIARDVIMPGATLDAYQTIFSPYTPAFSADDLKRLQAFVERGGIWVLGPLSACRTTENTAHQDACYGADLEKWLGVHVRQRMAPGNGTKFTADGTSVPCNLWCDAYQALSNQTVLGRYDGGPLNGLAAVVECPIGKGRVILLGTLPDPDWLATLAKRVSPPAEMTSDAGVMVVSRVDAAGKDAGLIAINTRNAAAGFRAPDGKRHELPPFGVEIHAVNE